MKTLSRLKTSRFSSIIFVSIIVLAAASLLSYFLIDKRDISWVSGHHRMDTFAGAGLIKALGKVYLPLWLLFLWCYVKNHLRPVLAGALAMLLTFAIAGPMKIIVHRQRPREVIRHSQIAKQSQEDNKAATQSRPAFKDIFKTKNQSFPSGDTATVFAVATAVVPFVSILCLTVIYILSAAVTFFRVAALAHYPSDVLAGAAVGIFCGWLALRISAQWILQNKFGVTDWWKKVTLVGIIVIPVLNIKHLLMFFHIFK